MTHASEASKRSKCRPSLEQTVTSSFSSSSSSSSARPPHPAEALAAAASGPEDDMNIFQANYEAFQASLNDHGINARMKRAKG